MKVPKILMRMAQPANRPPAKWGEIVSTVSSSHTQVTGMLAGFSATIVVLIIGLRFANSITFGDNPPADVSLGIFAMAFFGYVATGILFSISVERSDSHQYFLFSIGSIIYYFSGILSFSAVYPLILLIQSDALQTGVRIMIVGGLFGGYLAAAIPLYDLLLIRRRYIVGILSFSVAIGLIFNFLLTAELHIQTSTLLSRLLTACGLVVVSAFTLVVLTFFFQPFNKDGIYRLVSLIFMTLVTITLCFAIVVGFNAKSRPTPPVMPQLPDSPPPAPSPTQRS